MHSRPAANRRESRKFQHSACLPQQPGKSKHKNKDQKTAPEMFLDYSLTRYIRDTSNLSSTTCTQISLASCSPLSGCMSTHLWALYPLLSETLFRSRIQDSRRRLSAITWSLRTMTLTMKSFQYCFVPTTILRITHIIPS